MSWQQHYRFSLAGLLVAVTIIALVLLTVLVSFRSDATDFAVSLGGLNGCALLFGVLCALMGRSTLQAFWHASLFYIWGLACLEMTQIWDLTIAQRWSLVAIAAFYCGWLWFGRLPQATFIPASEDSAGTPAIPKTAKKRAKAGADSYCRF